MSRSGVAGPVPGRVSDGIANTPLAYRSFYHAPPPTLTTLVEKFMAPLFAGDRSGSRAIVAEAFEEGMSAEEILMQVIWPTMDKMQGLYRADRINTGVHHMAARLLRMLADQLCVAAAAGGAEWADDAGGLLAWGAGGAGGADHDGHCGGTWVDGALCGRRDAE